MSCHDPHVSKTKGLLRKEPRALCADCHDAPTPKPKFVHQPFENGECLSCHAPHASGNKGLLVRAGKANCFECHDDFLAKAKFKHSVVDDCSACHNSHGAAEKGLLIKSAGQLCGECHEPADMAKVKGHAGDALKTACLVCHDPHVSENKFLVKPAALKPVANPKP
jgi:predicted CXXCH cytochrome family protein